MWGKAKKVSNKVKFEHKISKYKRKEMKEVCRECLKVMKNGESYIIFPYLKYYGYLGCFIDWIVRAHYKENGEQM